MIREKKWTPGPWTARENADIETSDGEVFMPPGFHSQQIKANAALISAAPELVRELERANRNICIMCRIINQKNDKCTSCPENESRLDALAKAYGETP